MMMMMMMMMIIMIMIIITANRIDTTIVDKENKKVSVIEMSCPWVENREEKDAEKTTK